MRQENFNKAFVLLLMLFVSAIFLAMIWQFLMTLIMAGIFSALFHPFVPQAATRVRRQQRPGRGGDTVSDRLPGPAAAGGFLGLVTSEALKVGQAVKPWIQKQISEPVAFSDLLENIPFYDYHLP